MNPEQFSTPIHLDSGSDIEWFRIELPDVNEQSGFIDMWSLVPNPCGSLCDSLLYSADMSIYSESGELIGVSNGLGDIGGIGFSFGITDPRPPICLQSEPGTYPEYVCSYPVSPFSMVPLARGTYWLAAGNRLLATLHNWEVYTHASPTNPARDTTLYFNIHPAGVPYCDPDMNWDGNADSADIDYLINVIAGGENPNGRNPDFNRDGNADMGDVDALINVIAGGACK
ncbi:MAG: hypothetical protein WC718_18450 [Phycisphaerales bacterium]